MSFSRAASQELHVELSTQVCLFMKTFLVWIAWCLLFLLCWPVAIAALVLFPLVWLILLPFRLLGLTVAAGFALVRAVLFLPARLLGARPHDLA